MFQLPDGAPWAAVPAFSVLGLLLFACMAIVRGIWPQDSKDRKELLQEWQRECARRRLPPGDDESPD